MDITKFEKYIGSAEFKTVLNNMAVKANDVHTAVNQKYDGKPYFYHLHNVMKFTRQYLPLVCEMEKDVIPVMFGAYFHDSIEDARLTYNDVMKIAKTFMDEEQAAMATEIVYALTNEKGRNRHERANDKYYEGIRATNYAPLVKAADRLANYTYAKEHKTRMVDMYKEEMKEFVEKALTREDGGFFVPKAMVDELFS